MAKKALTKLCFNVDQVLNCYKKTVSSYNNWYNMDSSNKLGKTEKKNWKACARYLQEAVEEFKSVRQDTLTKVSDLIISMGLDLFDTSKIEEALDKAVKLANSEVDKTKIWKDAEVTDVNNKKNKEVDVARKIYSSNEKKLNEAIKEAEKKADKAIKKAEKKLNDTIKKAEKKADEAIKEAEKKIAKVIIESREKLLSFYGEKESCALGYEFASKYAWFLSNVLNDKTEIKRSTWAKENCNAEVVSTIITS